MHSIFFSAWMGKNTRNSLCLCVSVCVCEILSTCCCCYSTVVNARMHQKLATILADCHLSAFGDFFSPVSVFYSGSFMQVHKGSWCLSVQVTSCSFDMYRDVTVCMWMLSPGGCFQVFGGNQPLWDTSLVVLAGFSVLTPQSNSLAS